MTGTGDGGGFDVLQVVYPVVSGVVLGAGGYTAGLLRGRRQQPVWLLERVSGKGWTLKRTGFWKVVAVRVFADTMDLSSGDQWVEPDISNFESRTIVPSEPERGKAYRLDGLPDGHGIHMRWLELGRRCEGSMIVRAGQDRAEMRSGEVNRRAKWG